MSERIKKLQDLNTLAQLIRTAEEAKLAKARQAEQVVQERITALREDRKTECSAISNPQQAHALEAWLGWSAARIKAEQAKQARQRAQVETCFESFKKALGRASAIEDLLDKERLSEKRKRSRA